jgi:hypothetical protein
MADKMTWQERREKLELSIDAYMALLPTLNTSRHLRDLQPGQDKDTIMCISFLTEAARDSRFEAEREADQRKFDTIRGELREIAVSLPDSIIVPEGVVVAPQVVEIMHAGQQLKLLIERLEQLDL